MEIKRNRDEKTITISQAAYIQKIVKQYLGENTINAVTTPMQPG